MFSFYFDVAVYSLAEVFRQKYALNAFTFLVVTLNFRPQRGAMQCH